MRNREVRTHAPWRRVGAGLDQSALGLRPDDTVHGQPVSLLEAANGGAGLRANDPIFSQPQAQDEVQRTLRPHGIFITAPINLTVDLFLRADLAQRRAGRGQYALSLRPEDPINRQPVFSLQAANRGARL